MVSHGCDVSNPLHSDHKFHHVVVIVVVVVVVRREGEVKLDYMPPPREMEKALAARFIMTMASSPPDQQVIKMFFYAQHVSGWGNSFRGNRGWTRG